MYYDTLWSVRDTHDCEVSLCVCLCVTVSKWQAQFVLVCAGALFSSKHIGRPKNPCMSLAWCFFLSLSVYSLLSLPPSFSSSLSHSTSNSQHLFLNPHSLASLLLYHSLFPSCLKGRYLSLWIKTLHQWSDGELWVHDSLNQSVLDYRQARAISPSWIYWQKQKLPVKCCTDLKINSTC